ncbi:hypothetical protein [Subtercola vilae]|uniref:DUF4760 domain-containing protein n=1 Tax=Subtercola vilae TaxID=2056433 RepID=A0A4T2BQJ4_9MICO|nr:hypothetical protein [Subtercola vilae]TIH33102.1 hypothetical protein D4765_15295 [Subtercola vilae]
MITLFAAAAGALIAVLLAVLIVLHVNDRPARRREVMARRSLICALIEAGNVATIWQFLSASERAAAGLTARRLNLRLRISGLPGADAASNWSEHMLSELRRDSMNGGLQPALFDYFETQLRTWLRQPRRHSPIFRDYVELWDRSALSTAVLGQL